MMSLSRIKRVYHWLNLKPFWILVAVLSTISIGFLNFSADYTFNRSYGFGIDVFESLFNELTGTLVILIQIPFLFKFFQLYPLQRDEFIQRMGVYLGAMILYGVFHTLLMTIVRYPLYPLLGMGSYDPGDMVYRTLMETAKVSPTFWVFYLIQSYLLKAQTMRKEQLKLANTQSELSKARLLALQAQLNPHFLFNSLNLISSVMYEDVDLADKLMTDLADFLRYSLDLGTTPVVPLSKELEITQKYLDIMRARFGENLQITNDISPHTLSQTIPVLCLQPLLENAIKFTTEYRKDAQIALRAHIEGNQLGIFVVDNGPGIEGVKSSSSSSQNGLENIRHRLETLYGNLAEFSLKNSANGNGAVASIRIQITQDKE